ncbi:D-alanyl-D-alanine carboxypeptidase / D-alanyl-D-alanine-endopeptidase (penicillin-binding protein 4) [Actinomyces ruminicola]|uniref:D-alanyl-D-alanine carboxypeptidase / D-alanyl-D-alanine-endopeptidase (Penicillin-binding protein 4) n=1 Tax=Actinomyces ruminicola TaxID=332524 RepID=A0A1H0CNY9_9ACTO|nr:D-alanyl-D-alanine carboxypeptidase/D-alanyl-D-alanine-endopeptidase [Actinomyces ruminicola]SDN59582.1 D-alanyl-D-alanine carboxypeptidase / D-alanyl-D-alanine-endopeptidase (penicillin-binding protein 4) [Actinomyces ruminicola]
MHKAQIAALTAATLVVVGAYYGLADALDLVPGVLTASPADYAVQPFPTASAAPQEPEAASGLDADAPVPDAAELAALAETLAGDRRVGEGTTGVSIMDVTSGEELVDHGASTALTPASSNKLLVAWAALSLMGADHTLETRAVLDGSTVTLVGGGDVLLSDDAGDPDATVGRAGLGDLARAAAAQLQEQGVTSVSVALDDTLFTGPTWNSAWADGNESWVAPIQPLMVDVTAYPSGGYPVDPALEAAQTFAEHLRKAGIEVTGTVSRAAAGEAATEIAAVTSAPLADTLAVSLKASDNTMTEVEGRLVALAAGEEASFDGASRAVLSRLRDDGFDTSGVTLRDSCGLALGNKVPARLLAQIIARASAADAGTVGRSLMTALPVGGLDGTLDDRFIGISGAGTVRAKTGSLDTVASLTGTVVTADGRLLAFSVIVDGFAEGGLYSARLAIDDDLVSPLAACGCGG